MSRMKDDERRLLGAAQEAGEFVMPPDVSEDRCNVVLKNWALVGLVDLDSGKLTAKGRSAKGAIVPQAEPIPVAVVGSAIVEPIPLETDSVVIVDLDSVDAVNDDEDSE